MRKTRLPNLSFRLFGVLVLFSLVFAGLQNGTSGRARAQEQYTPTPTVTTDGAVQPGIQPLAADGSSLYYYADGERIPLTPSLDWVSVKFASDNLIEQAGALLGSGAPLNLLAGARHIPNPELTLLPVQQGVTPKALVEGINSMRAMSDSFLAADPVFETNDAEMAITDQFIVTFPAGESMDDINTINSAHSVEIVEPLLGQDNTFVLKASPDAHLDALAMANLYQESGLAINAAPDFVRIMAKPVTNHPNKGQDPAPQGMGPMGSANDYWYSDQWSLNNVQQFGTFMTYDADIDAPEAWDHNTGSSSVTIAVIDEGVELTQEDLIAKLVTGYDATGGGSGGGPCTAPCGDEDDAHGTNVAGLAAASTNNGTPVGVGIAGVCQGCRIMPVRIAYGDGAGHWITTDSNIANGIAWAYQNGASILSNSWGGGSNSTAINTAISNAKTLGRGGKGSVVVFAAGNNNSSTVSYPASLSTVIAVGASNMCDQRKAPTGTICDGYENWGSNYGSALDISAPGLWLDSTDRMGSAGYSSGGYYGANYFGYMNGTSGATPIVSGVAGLILSVNSALTADQVQTILQNSVDDVNSGSYPGWDQYMGYGRVNANKAVQAAAITLSISGNAGVNGATITYTGGSTTADASGHYSITGVPGWTGTVTPSKNGVTFTPNHRDYTNVTSDQLSQDYSAVAAGAPLMIRFSPSDGSQACKLPPVGLTLYLSNLVRTGGSFDRSTVALKLDGSDVTTAAAISQTSSYPVSHASILYTPLSNLALGVHQVALTYPSTAGQQTHTWSFTVADIVCTSSQETPPVSGAAGTESTNPTISTTTTTEAPKAIPTLIANGLPESKPSSATSHGNTPTIWPRDTRNLKRPI